MNDKVLMERRKITDELIHDISISKDEKTVHLLVNLMDGRFVIEKTFQNCFSGLSNLGIVCLSLDSEAKVFRYLRIGEEENVNKS